MNPNEVAASGRKLLGVGKLWEFPCSGGAFLDSPIDSQNLKKFVLELISIISDDFLLKGEVLGISMS